MKKSVKMLVLTCLLTMLFGCTPNQTREKIVIATTPWLGYYPLYYAEEIRLDEKLGIDIHIIESLSSNDFRRSIVKNHIDGFAASIQGLSQINQILSVPIELALFTNFSNGGDVIVAKKDIPTMAALQGKRLGFQRNEISHFVAKSALNWAGMEVEDVRHVETKPLEVHEMFERDELDAFVTYPPISLGLLEDENLHTIFTSKVIPNRIVDCLVIKGDRSEEKSAAIRELWEAVIEKIVQEPNAYLRFLAEQLGTTIPEAQLNLNGIHLLNWEQQAYMFESPEIIKELLLSACEVNETKESVCIRDLHLIRFGKVEK